MTRKQGFALGLLAALFLVVALAGFASARVERARSAGDLTAAAALLNDGGVAVASDCMLTEDGADR